MYKLSGHLQCKEVEGVNGVLARAVSLTRLAEATLAAAPVLRREDEGSEPEVREDQVKRSQVSAVSANQRKDGANKPETQSDDSLEREVISFQLKLVMLIMGVETYNDFLVDNVDTAVVVLGKEPRDKTSVNG